MTQGFSVGDRSAGQPLSRHRRRVTPASWWARALAVSVAVVAGLSLFGRTASAQTGTDAKAMIPEARFESLTQMYADAESPAAAISLLYRIDELAGLVPVDEYRTHLEDARSKVAFPSAKFALSKRLYRESLRRDIELSADASVSETLSTLRQAHRRRAHCLVDWRVVGPFDNDSMDGFNTRLGPERGESGPYEGKKRQIAWRDFPSFARGCHLFVGSAVRPSSSSVAYLTRTIQADSSGPRRLLVGADGAYRIWVNGELVAERSKDRGFAADAQAWDVTLERGTNRILVKLGSSRTGNLSLMARLLGPQLGKPDVDTTAFDPTDDADSYPGQAVTSNRQPDAVNEGDGRGRVSVIRSCARDTSLRVERRIDCLVTWSAIESAYAAEPWEDIADNLVRPLRQRPGWSRGPFQPADTGVDGDASTSAKRQNEADGDAGMARSRPLPGLDARAIARLAHLYDSHDDRIGVLRVARRRAPDDPVIALRLARAESSSLEDTSDHRRKRRLTSIRQQHPEMWPATMELANWYASHGYGGRALALARQLELKEADRRRAYVSRLAYLESQYGVRSRARQWSRRAATMNRLGTGWIREHVGELIAQGNRGEANRWIAQQLALHPWSMTWTIKLANLHRASGETEAALAGIDDMLERVPGATRLYRYKAQLLAADGRREPAIATLERALEYDPQNQQLQDYLAHLRPSVTAFHEPWMVESVRNRADTQPASDHAIDTIIDQTVVRVSPNGLSQRVVQIVKRVNTVEGIEDARSESVSFRSGDEYVDVLSARVYKPDGRVLEEYGEWTSGGSRKGSSYYNDLKYRHIRVDNVEKGDLVEFRYRLKQSAGGNFRGDYFGDVSYVQSTRPIGFARYVVEAPETWELHFNPPEQSHQAIDSRPGESEVPEGFRVHGFELRDVPAVQTDPDMPGYTDVYDYLMVSNKETWDEIGEWWWGLVEEQLITSDPIKQQVATLVDGLETDRQKMEAIHNWVVKNTRYLHLGLGVHGWKPYKTTRAFNNKFGDCKDKASLLKVMLEEAGIPTQLVLVRTRDLGHVQTRPASMHIFNHAINYVPKFDLYLDPTAEFNGTTELTPMDQGAQGLIVRDGGDAKFVTLPIDEPTANTLRRRLTVELPKSPDATPGARVKGEFVATGQNAVYYRRSLQDPDRRNQTFEKQLADTYAGATLQQATYRYLSDLEKQPEITFEFDGGRFLRGSEGTQFVYPYGTERDLLSRYAQQSERQQDLTIRVPFVNETRITYQLPKGRRFESIPASVEMTSEFGMLKIAYNHQSDSPRSLTVDIRYSLDKQRVPVERYDPFRQFLSKMTDALNRTISVVPDD